MGDENHDPFEGLVLDEAFIRGATSYEPPARTREALRKHQPGSPRAWSPTPRRRRKLTSLLLIAVVVIGSAGYAAIRLGGLPDLGGQGGPTPQAGKERTISNEDFHRGDCYTWDQRLLDSVARDVDCSEPHLFEDVKRTTLKGHGVLSAFPSTAEWVHIDDTVCGGFVATYLHHAIDPDGRYAAGAVQPSSLGWAEGQRTLECGVIYRAASAFGASETELLDVWTGRADGSQQFLAYPIGTCLRYAATDYGSVPCAQAHNYEVVGTATIDGPAAAPTDGAFGRMASEPCRRLVSTYVGHRFVETSHQFVSWDRIQTDSWRAGERTFDCYLAFGRDGSSASVRGAHQSTGRSV